MSRIKNATARGAAAAKIARAVKKQGGVIGALVYWGLDDVWITVAELEALYQKHDLGMEWFPATLRGSTAFRKAIERCAPGNRGWLLRPILDDDTRIVYGIVSEKVDRQAVKVDHDFHAIIGFNKDTETVKSSTQPASPPDALRIADHIKATYQELTGTFIAKDIQRMLRRNINKDMGAITLRRNGGVYFVAPDYLPLVEKHQRIVEEIGECEMGIVVISEDDPHNQRTIGRDARRNLEDQLNELRTEITKFLDKPAKDRVLADRLSAFKMLKQRCKMYRSILGIQIKDLTQGLDACATQVKGMIGGTNTNTANQDPEEPEQIRRLRRVQ